MKEILTIGLDCIERFFTTDEFPTLSTYQIEVAGQSFLKPPYVIERSIPFHILLVTVRGSGFYNFANQRGTLKRGHVLFVPAHHNFRYEIKHSKTWSINWFLLKPSTLWQSIDHGSDQQAVLNPDHLDNLLGLLHSERQGNIKHTTYLCRITCEQIFYLIDRILNRRSSISLAQQRLRALYAKIEDNPAHPWTTDEIAQLCCVSTSYLHKLTLRCYGLSPMAQVNKVRLKRATVLLETTNQPIMDIALNVGFTNAKAFSTAYKREMGQSPSAIRKAR